MFYSHVRANSRVGTMPYRMFIGACVNKAVHMYDSCEQEKCVIYLLQKKSHLRKMMIKRKCLVNMFLFHHDIRGAIGK